MSKYLQVLLLTVDYFLTSWTRSCKSAGVWLQWPCHWLYRSTLSTALRSGDWFDSYLTLNLSLMFRQPNQLFASTIRIKTMYREVRSAHAWCLIYLLLAYSLYLFTYNNPSLSTREQYNTTTRNISQFISKFRTVTSTT